MKHNFQLEYNPDIYEDIQKFVRHYRIETGSHDLGKQFVKTVKEALKKLKSSALQYQIRYDDIRFLPIPSFSFVAHYSVDTKKNIVSIEAILHTSQSPDKWKSI